MTIVSVWHHYLLHQRMPRKWNSVVGNSSIPAAFCPMSDTLNTRVSCTEPVLSAYVAMNDILWSQTANRFTFSVYVTVSVTWGRLDWYLGPIHNLTTPGNAYLFRKVSALLLHASTVAGNTMNLSYRWFRIAPVPRFIRNLSPIVLYGSWLTMVQIVISTFFSTGTW